MFARLPYAAGGEREGVRSARSEGVKAENAGVKRVVTSKMVKDGGLCSRE